MHVKVPRNEAVMVRVSPDVRDIISQVRKEGNYVSNNDALCALLEMVQNQK
jgi:hypothetical protein